MVKKEYIYIYIWGIKEKWGSHVNRYRVSK